MYYKMVLTNLTPLPAEYLYPGTDDASKKSREAYEKSDKLNNGGKWWSMYDLMRYFHSGFLPEEGDSNFIKFELDLTKPELKLASLLDPKLQQEIDAKINPLVQDFSSKIQDLISKMREEMTTNVAAAAAQRGAPMLMAKGGRHKRIRGGDSDTTNAINELVDPMNLKTFILNSISGLEFTSLDRIFITNSVKGQLELAPILGIKTDASVIELAIRDANAAANAPADANKVGGRRYKTRKHRHKGKSHGKTRRGNKKRK